MAADRYLGFDPTGYGAVRSAVPKNPTLEPNTKSIGGRVAELNCHLKFSQNVQIGPEVGRWSVINIHTSYTDLIYSSFATSGM